MFDSQKEKPHGPNLEDRSEFFRNRSLEIFQEIYSKTKTPPNHIVHVTCTGYVSPSAPQILVSTNEWNTDVTHAYHMGCYASLPAVRMAEGFISSSANSDPPNKNYSVDVVHTEMCALHLNPQLTTPEQIIVQSLFSDGSIKYKLQIPGTAKKGMHLYLVQEKIISGTEKHMTWVPQSWGFHMTLSREVPEILKNNIRSFMINMVDKAGFDLADISSKAKFAIHPGGPRIIDVVQEELELREDQVTESKQVLFERGNMSSATLPYVWKKIMDQNLPSGTPVISLAFGPGLTVFGAIFKVI